MKAPSQKTAHDLLPASLCLMELLGEEIAQPFDAVHFHRHPIALLCYAMLCYAMLCYAMLCYAMLCYAMLCCAVLCCAVLCCAVLCCAVLCCAVLCCCHTRWLCPTTEHTGAWSCCIDYLALMHTAVVKLPLISVLHDVTQAHIVSPKPAPQVVGAAL